MADQQPIPPGTDVTALMSGADVTALMNGPAPNTVDARPIARAPVAGRGTGYNPDQGWAEGPKAFIAGVADAAPAAGATIGAALAGPGIIPLMLAAGGGGAAGKLAQLTERRAVEGAPPMAGSDVAKQVGGEAALDAALAVLPVAATNAIKGGARMIYGAAIKPTVTALKEWPAFRSLGESGARREAMQLGLDRGYMPGSTAIGRDIGSLNDSVLDQLKAASNGPGTIDPKMRVTYLPEVRAGLASDTTAGPAGLKAVQRVENRYLKNPLNNLGLETPLDTHTAKVAAYRNNRSFYANRGTPEGDAEAAARAALARGMRDDELRAVPGIARPMAEEAKLIPLQDMLDRAGSIGASRDPVSIGTLASPTSPKTILGLMSRRGAMAGTAIGADRAANALGANQPPSVRLAILEALRAMLPGGAAEQK